MEFSGSVIEEIPGVEPLRGDARSETIDRKSEYPSKEQDSKTTIEPKKKPIDFKIKTEQKYQKSFKDDDSKRSESNEAVIVTTTPMPSTKSVVQDTTARPMETPGVTIPLLFRGEPIVTAINLSVPIESSTSSDISSTSESSTDSVRVTEETAAFRGRALNISAPEPTNSLHSNITDLSDVSMDDDDKEVEGNYVYVNRYTLMSSIVADTWKNATKKKRTSMFYAGGEYVASHNETAINISSTLLPTVNVCVEENRTYTVGERIIRGCEEKCICGESGIPIDCKPLCSSPYVRANRGVEDPLCQEKLVNEEPCCAILVCAADSGELEKRNAHRYVRKADLIFFPFFNSIFLSYSA